MKKTGEFLILIQATSQVNLGLQVNSLLQGLKYMIITLDKKIIIIKQEMLEPFQITQSELMGKYFGIH